ncbi:thioesterase family protein [Brevibacillus fluminis]|uniref:thioesterase family protein n=1 Tax=Brevibacillus fluminis TaxID=511487 RepID=UPI003F8B3B7B
MKNGLLPGVEATVRITVTEAMLAAFDGEVIHPVLSTVSMIYHMEKAGRAVILPFLEEDEEGCGFAVEIKHVGPAVIGQEVVFRAVCTEVTDTRVVCEVTAHTALGRVGYGSFTQALFKKEDMKRRIQDLQKQVEATR